MKISVITVCFNSSSTIKDAVDSVLAQEGVELEYIVIDGGSSDNTVDLLRGYGGRIAQLVSEPDEGIYDAMNKGVSRATGDVVGILNSDDFYAHDQVLSQVMAAFESGEVQSSDGLGQRSEAIALGAGASSRAPTVFGGNDGALPSSEYESAIDNRQSEITERKEVASVDCVFGDLDYVDAEDTSRVVRAWRSKPYTPGAFKRGWHPAHPSFFVRRSVYERFGAFDLNLPIAADYEFMLRVLERYRMPSVHLADVFVKMREGGASNASLQNIFKANLQCWKAWRQNGLGWSPLPVLAKPLSKLKQLGK